MTRTPLRRGFFGRMDLTGWIRGLYEYGADYEVFIMNMALAGLVMLVIGDSHMAAQNYLISTLHDSLVSQQAIVHTYGACGANAGDWVYGASGFCGQAERHEQSEPLFDRANKAKNWTVKELIERHHPNLVVVQMGDTMAGYGQAALPKSWIYGKVRALTKALKAQHVACIWVGPPWGSEGSSYRRTYARVREMSDFLSKSVAPCEYIDSTAFSKPGEWPTTDGQHLTANGYRTWGKSIADSIVRSVGQGRTRSEVR